MGVLFFWFVTFNWIVMASSMFFPWKMSETGRCGVDESTWDYLMGCCFFGSKPKIGVQWFVPFLLIFFLFVSLENAGNLKSIVD